jgi:hypothetical protein
MIIINLMGGLGNQMFQYAAARQLALVHNATLKIDTSDFWRMTLNREHVFQLQYFNIKAQQASAGEIAGYKPPRRRFGKFRDMMTGILAPRRMDCRRTLLYEEPPGSEWKPGFPGLGPDRYLIGYFNSYKYFDSIRDILREEFTPKDEISSQAQEMIRQIEKTNSIGLHVRRGDYITDRGVQRCIEGIITENYYRHAAGHILRHVAAPHFFIFSDDMPWVREHFLIPGPMTYVDINPPQRGFEDLWLMSRCKHNITAGGSTFSWWAAYLNRNPDKIVIRTERISNEVVYNHPDDYFPPEWIAVPS